MTEIDSRPIIAEPSEAGRDPRPDKIPAKFNYLTVCREIAQLLSKQIFFLGGTVKSGTSWLQYLLDLHPQVSCGGESHFIDSLYPALRKALKDHNLHILDKGQNVARYELGSTPELFAAHELDYVMASAMLVLLLKQERGKPVLAVGEKTPVNVQIFGVLTGLIPGAKCIHILRDPRDGAVSGWHHVSRIYPDEARRHFAAMLDYVKEYANTWVIEVGRGVEFGAQNPNQYLEVRYEDLVHQSVPTLARVFRFLGVDDSDAVVRRCIDGGSFERMTGGRSPGLEDSNSFFRKGIVGDWRNRLDASSLDYLTQKAGALMQRFGYL